MPDDVHMKLLLCFSLFLTIIIIYSIVENRFIKTTVYVVKKCKDGTIKELRSKENNEMPVSSMLNIVQLSDLHGCCYGKQNSNLLNKIIQCKPDVILLTGDIKSKYQSVSPDLYFFLQQLSKVAPCIYSLGNHELKDREKYPDLFDTFIQKLKEFGIIVSDNTAVSLKLNQISCLFASYSSSLINYKKRNRHKIQNDINKVISFTERKEADIRILLSHDPELSEQYLSTDYSLIFSGHLHGGIVRIPGCCGIISTRFVLFPRYDGGCYALDDKHMLIVSRGLGSHTVKFRLFNRPEVVHTVIYFEEN